MSKYVCSIARSIFVNECKHNKHIIKMFSWNLVLFADMLIFPCFMSTLKFHLNEQRNLRSQIFEIGTYMYINGNMFI